MTKTFEAPTFASLLATVATEPGKLEQAFSRFHNFSIGNQLLALFQCYGRGIVPGPIATYPAWQALGRQVRKGEKALELWMPITGSREETDETTGETTIAKFTRFALKSRWFVLSQTEGQAYEAPATPEWQSERALSSLDIRALTFDALDGNAQGFAVGRGVAVSPIAERPLATLVHEIAHVVLGHTTGEARLEDGAVIGHATREVEAESVALLVLGCLGQDGLEYCRGYVQSYLRGNTIDERTAQRIFKAADTILRAGRQADAEEVAA
jgi:antirestriction protein ArdC